MDRIVARGHGRGASAARPVAGVRSGGRGRRGRRRGRGRVRRPQRPSAAARRVLELADRLRLARERPTTAPPVGRHQPQQEDDRLAGDQQQPDDREQQDGADRVGQFQATLSGVRTMKTTSTTTWNRKQPRPGPRSASRSSPLYWTGPVWRGRRRRRRVRPRIDGLRRSRGGTIRQAGVAAPSLGRSRLRRQPVDDLDAGQRAQGSPATTTTFHEREPPPSTIRSPGHHPGVDPDRQVRPAARTRSRRRSASRSGPPCPRPARTTPCACRAGRGPRG